MTFADHFLFRLRQFVLIDPLVIINDLINQHSQVNRILKVAKPNIVVTKLLAGGHKKDIKVSVSGKSSIRLNCHNGKDSVRQEGRPY